MLKKHKLFFAILISLGLAASWGSTFAAELTYPTLNFGGTQFNITNTTSIVDLIKYLFIFFIVAVGIIAVISVAYHGARILLFSTVGNPDAIAEARHNIFGSVLGIVLLLFSFILLNTINPELTTLKLPSFTGSSGASMYYQFCSEGNCEYSIPAPGAETNMRSSETDPDEAWFWDLYALAAQNENAKLYLVYSCGPPNKNALVWLFSRTYFRIDARKNNTGDSEVLPTTNSYGTVQGAGGPQETKNVRMVKLWCGGSGDVDRAEGGGNEITIFDPANPTQDVLSWIWSNEDTGAYFYSTKNCTGIPTQVKKETTNTITPFIGTNPNAAAPQSVRITNSVDAKEVYGVYPARVPQRGPSCTDMAIINPCQPSDQNPGIRAGQLDTYGCPYTNDLATANAVLTRANDRATIPSQALSEIVNTQCYPIPLGDDGAAFGPTSAYIFHYRKSTSGLARNSTALQLDDGQRFASLSVDYLDRSKNTPAQGAKLYWSYPNPDTLITTPIPGVPITKYGEPPFYPAKPRSTYAKELQFNYRKSYTVFLKAEHPTADNLDVCVAYESSIYLPFRSVYQSGRYIYRMDVIPTYVQSFF